MLVVEVDAAATVLCPIPGYCPGKHQIRDAGLEECYGCLAVCVRTFGEKRSVIAASRVAADTEFICACLLVEQEAWTGPMV
jgi:hypothetical protein